MKKNILVGIIMGLFLSSNVFGKADGYVDQAEISVTQNSDQTDVYSSEKDLSTQKVEKDDNQMCAMVITYARGPQGQVNKFNNSCIPDGWEKVGFDEYKEYQEKKDERAKSGMRHREIGYDKEAETQLRSLREKVENMKVEMKGMAEKYKELKNKGDGMVDDVKEQIKEKFEEYKEMKEKWLEKRKEFKKQRQEKIEDEMQQEKKDKEDEEKEDEMENKQSKGLPKEKLDKLRQRIQKLSKKQVRKISQKVDKLSEKLKDSNNDYKKKIILQLKEILQNRISG